ncbi:MAG: PEGA domain-containing protein [Gemmatimonadota bacterium]
MNLMLCITAAAVSASALSSCRESDQLIEPGANARIEVTSDPEGALVYLDGRNTGEVTPHTLAGLTLTQHEILVRQDHGEVTYGFRARVDVKSDTLHRVHGPLIMRCTNTDCAIDYHTYHELNGLRPASNPNGALFYYNATERGLYWPTGTIDGYASIGLPVIAALAGTRDTLALGVYDVSWLAGRPAPQIIQSADRYTMRQTFWVLPPLELAVLPVPTMRGIEVEEELIGTSGSSDVAFIRLTFRNITNRESYRAVDPLIPSAGITYNWVYLGFALDADIGNATDDMVTYDPALNMVYMYDMDFQDDRLARAPGLIGLRLLEAPPGATVRALNAWPSGNDWRAGDVSERFGYGMISGTRIAPLTPDMPGQQIGLVPSTNADYRMSVSAGPITLEPGASASITVAVMLARPVPGTYTPGQNVNPENPTTGGRTIERIAGALLDKASNLVVPN